MRRFALVAGAVLLVAAIAAGIGGTLVWRSVEASLPPLPDPKAIATSTIVVDRNRSRGNPRMRPITV